MFDEVKRIGESPMPLKALVSSVMPMSTSSDSPRAKESQVAALDTFATAADPHHRSPKLCNILHHVVQVTHSPQTAYAITHLGLGIGAKRYTRPQHLPGQMTSESKDPPLPDKDTVIGTDNDGHYELHASEQTATYHPGHQPQVFSRGFTLTDASQNTGAQKEPIERKPQNAASPGLTSTRSSRATLRRHPPRVITLTLNDSTTSRTLTSGWRTASLARRCATTSRSGSRRQSCRASRTRRPRPPRSHSVDPCS